MQTLYQLIEALPSNFQPEFAPRLNELFFFVQAHKGLSEKEAAELHLGDAGRVKYFNILKSDLKRVLFWQVIAIPSWSKNKHKALYEDSFRLYANYKIFLLNNKREIAIDIARGLLSKLQKLELYNLVYSVADDLSIHYSVIDVSIKQRRKYAQLATEALVDMNAYATVRHHYGKLISMCNIRASYTPKIKRECVDTMKVVQPLIKKGRHNINRFIYIIIICRYTVEHNYEKIIHYCDEALESFPKNHPNIRSLSFVFLLNKTSALIPLNRLEEAKRIARETLQIVPKHSFNWHLILLKRIVVCLHAQDYQEAYELFKAHERKKCVYPIIQEYWNIIKGYLYFLIQRNYIQPYANERFSLGKFLNEMPIYSRDKAGNNINILIVQILIQMVREQYPRIIDRVDSLREYARVYTRNEESKRANIFIKMIMKMEAARFHRQRTEIKTQKLAETLTATPLRMGQNLAIEIIPFPVLWGEMLSILENKFRTMAKPREANRKHKTK